MSLLALLLVLTLDVVPVCNDFIVFINSALTLVRRRVCSSNVVPAYFWRKYNYDVLINGFGYWIQRYLVLEDFVSTDTETSNLRKMYIFKKFLKNFLNALL